VNGRIQILHPEYKAESKPRTVEERNQALVSELAYLRSEVKRLESVIKFKDGVLLDQVHFFEEVLRENKHQSIEGLKRRISQLKGAMDREQGGLPGD
jgi:hypothetical protein